MSRTYTTTGAKNKPEGLFFATLPDERMSLEEA